MKLTARQNEIAQGLFNEMPRKAIAGDLGLSPKTVDYHVENIKKKLNVQTVIGMIKRMCAGTLLLAVSAFTVSGVELVWTPPDDPNVTGYYIYYGIAPGTYTNSILTAATNLFITNLVAGCTYYFAATATNDFLESIYSNEVAFTNDLSQLGVIQVLRVGTAHFGLP